MHSTTRTKLRGPWLYGMEFVAHFFGLARVVLPNFTYAEMPKNGPTYHGAPAYPFSGNFKEKREKQSGVGYILDFDAAPLTPEDFRLAIVKLTSEDINKLVELAYKEAEMICRDLLKISVACLSADKHVQLVPVGTGKPDLSDDWSDKEDPKDELDDESIGAAGSYNGSFDKVGCS